MGGSGDCRDGFCAKKPRNAPTLDRDHPSWVQDGSTAVKSWLSQSVTTLQTVRSVKKEREEVLQALGQIPLQPMEGRHQWGRLSPCSPWRRTTKQISYSLWRAPQWSRYTCLERSCMAWRTLKEDPDSTCGPVGSRSHAAIGFLVEPVTLWGTHTRAICSSRAASHGRKGCWSSSWKNVACGTGSRGRV